MAAALLRASISLSYEGECRSARWRRWPSRANVEHHNDAALTALQLDVAVFWRQWLNWQATPAQRARLWAMRWRAGLLMPMRQQATACGDNHLVFSGGDTQPLTARARVLPFYLSDFKLLFPAVTGGRRRTVV